MKVITYLAILLALCFVQQTLTAYSPPIALQMAYMSAVAYESVISIDGWNCKYCQQYKINNPKTFFNLTTGVRGFIGFSASLSSIVVSFKGADNINTFIQDIKTARVTYDLCPGCQVSKSFYQLYQSVKPTVLSSVQSLHRIYRNSKIIITGHGLGGTFALMAALDIKQIYQFADAVYTFGSCRVGNEQFAKYYTSQVPQTYRVINYGDIVPHLPVATAGFVHSSVEQWYQKGMQEYKTCQGQSPSCANSLPVGELNVADNAFTNYLNLKAVTVMSANNVLSLQKTE